MPRKRSRIVCSKCYLFGGALTLRTKRRTKDGDVDNKKYFHIKHFSLLAKHKNKSCYIGRPGMLTYVALLDKRYDEVYEPNMKSINLKEFNALDKKAQEDLIKRRLILLYSMGWPEKYLVHKYVADVVNAGLERESEYYKKSGPILDERFNDELNRRVDIVLADISFSDKRGSHF